LYCFPEKEEYRAVKSHNSSFSQTWFRTRRKVKEVMTPIAMFSQEEQRDKTRATVLALVPSQKKFGLRS
jgi:hypothetical protein